MGTQTVLRRERGPLVLHIKHMIWSVDYYGGWYAPRKKLHWLDVSSWTRLGLESRSIAGVSGSNEPQWDWR